MYFDRLKTASYESPSGLEFAFSYVRVTREINHRIGAFEFSGVPGTLHQDKGVSGEIFPFNIFFHGPDYDIISDRFSNACKEIGPGFLNHPRWGRIRVQILTVKQNENIVSGGGQASFEVEFQETLEREFPATSTATQKEVKNLADISQESSIENFADQVSYDSVSEELSHEQGMITAANSVRDTLSSIAASSQEISAEFNGYIDDIIDNAAELVDEPLRFALDISSAIRVISEVPGRITSKLQGLKNLFNIVALQDITEPTNSGLNSTLITEIVLTSGIVSASEGVSQAIGKTSSITRNSSGRATITTSNIDDGFQTRGEVLTAVKYLQDNFIAITDKLDETQEVFKNELISESYIQTVQSYSPSWEVAGIVIKSGLDLSFSLPVKRVMITDRSRTILDLSYEFYGNIDDSTLDYFILTNDLAGNNIVEIPAGTAVIYYD